MKLATKTNITYYTSDIFLTSLERITATNNSSNVIVPHVCNNVGLFGSGFASAISHRFPIVKENFTLLGNKTKLGYVQYVSVLKDKISENELVFANMIAQNKTISNNNKRPINYEALVKSMINVREYANDISKFKDSTVEIHCPKFGSGLAGGNWNFIENLIQDIWSSLRVCVYIYKAS